jgi:hypothetical protein
MQRSRNQCAGLSQVDRRLGAIVGAGKAQSSAQDKRKFPGKILQNPAIIWGKFGQFSQARGNGLGATRQTAVAFIL